MEKSCFLSILYPKYDILYKEMEEGPNKSKYSVLFRLPARTRTRIIALLSYYTLLKQRMDLIKRDVTLVLMCLQYFRVGQFPTCRGLT